MPQEYRTLRVAPAGAGVLSGLSQRIAELYPPP
jgi:hypothetical protein